MLDLQIPQGEAPGTADDTAQAALGINLFANRQCGRYLAIADAATASATVCSKYFIDAKGKKLLFNFLYHNFRSAISIQSWSSF